MAATASGSMLGRARSPLAWIRLLIGLWLFAAGVVLGLRSGMGVGPWDVLHDGIRKVTPLSFGVATIAVGLVVMVAGAVAGVRPGPGTLVNMVVVGVFSDVMLASGVGAGIGSGAIVPRLGAVLLGVALVAAGSALYIGAGLGSGPRDSLMLALSARTGVRVGIVRAGIEGTALLTGFLLGGSAGVGTILFAFGIGPAVEVAFRLFRVEVPGGRRATHGATHGAAHRRGVARGVAHGHGASHGAGHATPAPPRAAEAPCATCESG